MKWKKKTFFVLVVGGLFFGSLVLHARRNPEEETPSVENAKGLGSRNLLAKKPVQTLLASLSATSLDSLQEKLTSRLRCSADSAEEEDTARRVAAMNGAVERRTGYILALSFQEQQTRAADNLFSLQCWAKTLFVNIVEPFVLNSHLVIPLNDTQQGLPTFRDLFDIHVWQLLSAKHKFAPLATWESFVSSAPRDLIAVSFRHRTPKEHRKKLENGEELAHFAVNDDYKEGCKLSPKFAAKIRHLQAMNFTVVREVCFNFAEGDKLMLQQFNRHLYLGLAPKKVTVLMEEWRGTHSAENGKRVVLFDACWLPKPIQSTTYLWPSKQLVCDAEKYRRKFLHTNNYVSIMVRTEKVQEAMEEGKGKLNSMSSCLNETLRAWRSLMVSSGATATFLSMDIGTHGSETLAHKNNQMYGKGKDPYEQLYAEFLTSLLGPHITLKMWESMFEDVASYLEPGYIASLQKTIAAQSKCIVLTGGGSLQKHTKYMYERLAKNQCVTVLHQCSKGRM